MNNNLLLTGIGVLVLIGLGGWFLANNDQPASTATNPAPVVSEPRVATFNLTLADRKLTPDIVTVTQEDQVTIRVMSDETGEFHISGYEIENDMKVGTELTFSFTADKAGRYNFELHPKTEGAAEEEEATATEEEAAEEEDIVIGAFVVNPR